MLGNNYLKLLYAGNPVLINRLKKYINRGFQISINNPKTKQVEDITEDIRLGKLFQQPRNVINSQRNSAHNSSRNSPHNTSHNVDLSDIKTSIEKRNISGKLYKIDINPKMGNNINVDANLVKPINITTLTHIDREAIRYYTGSGYEFINSFLYKKDYEVRELNMRWAILKYLKQKFPENDNTQLMYYYFINLYNTIQKGPTANTIFKVYRGTKNWYLNTSKDKAYYMNSFTSTTTRWKTAHQFGSSRNIYIFYIHPLCRYMNVSSLSITKSEDEILLTPYHKYIYVDETDAGNGYILRKYIVLPTDIDIPSSFKEFMEWKNSIAIFSAAARGALTAASNVVASNVVAIPNAIPVETKYINVSNLLKGGKIAVYNNLDNIKSKLNPKKTRKSYTKSRPRSSRKSYTKSRPRSLHKKLNKKFVHIKSIKNKSKMNTTRKVKKSTKSYTKDYIKRMTAPIPSFPAKPLSTIEKTIIDQMKAYIKKDKENIISDFA
jgi:hypothetical protein